MGNSHVERDHEIKFEILKSSCRQISHGKFKDGFGYFIRFARLIGFLLRITHDVTNTVMLILLNQASNNYFNKFDI